MLPYMHGNAANYESFIYRFEVDFSYDLYRICT